MAALLPSSSLTVSWQQALGEEFDKAYFRQLRAYLEQQVALKKTIFPPADKIFNALNSTPLHDVKVVILGQDPYHGPDQAHGLSFSVPNGVALPPSLRNIYKELIDDLQLSSLAPLQGNLQSWTQQGVLLLNAVLTVEQGKAAAHQKQGWEQFTDAVINCVNELSDPVVFILWGSYAQKKARIVNAKKHCVISGVHPSPLSAHRGFFGSKPFSQCNAFLQQQGRSPIAWSSVLD